MGQLRQLASQTVVYGASSVLGRVLNYLLVPLYTAVFSPEDYGVVTELYAFVAFLNIVYTYGFETAYFRFATKSNDARHYFNVAQTSLITTSVLFSAALILFSEGIASLLEYPGQGKYVVWLALVLAIDAIVAVPFARLRLEGKALRFATFKLGNIGLNIGLNIFFLVFCPWWLAQFPDSSIWLIYFPQLGVGYVFISNLIANGFYLLFFAPWLIRMKLLMGRDWKVMMLYAAPLLVMGFAGVTNEMLSRVLLKYWLPVGFYPGQSNQEILGVFGACYKLSVFMTLAVQAFRYAFEPFFFSKSADKNSPELFAKVMHGFIIFGSFSWLVISLVLQDLAPLFLRQSSYLSALDIVPWLLGGGLFLGVYFNLSVWYKLTDQTKYGAWITILGSLVTIGLNFALIPVLGYMGSAMTTFLSYLLMVCMSYVIGQKHYFVPYKTGKGLFYMALAGLSILAFYFCDLCQEYKYFSATGLITLFVAMVWLLDFRKQTFNK
ncbi:MAG: lipopolysaccharide biosynthesis protein [Marinoscillum sp.]|uniref:lipopolysaccharide biosynthesis protein n=2 Tax=Marinoscillum sp. TaxID=2024838 RepID=UPI0032F65B7A